MPPDFLEGYTGGISIQQYEQIRQLAGVEVAAPIAYIGYVAVPSPSISFPNRNFAPGFYQLSWTVSAFNGEQHLVEYQASQIFYIVRCGAIYSIFPLAYILQHPDQQAQSVDSQYDQCPLNVKNLPPPILEFSTPNTGKFLLAAIDPSAESQLVHLNQSVTAGRMLTEQDTIHPDTRIPLTVRFANSAGQTLPIEAVPMLIHQNLPGQISLTAEFIQLVLGSLPVDQIQKLSDPAFVAQLPNQRTIFSGPIPLVQDDPQRFANAHLAWDGHQWQVLPFDPNENFGGGAFNYQLDFFDGTTPTGLTYQPTVAPDGSQGEQLVPTSAQGPEVGFRPLSPLHTLQKEYIDVVYTYEEEGQFSDARIASEFDNPLNWLPENTYTAPPVVMRYDAQGHPISPTMLLPTTNQAGYLLQPPLALTTLAAAQQLVGNQLINAIRVRVYGVSQANQDSWKRIQQVAGEIQQQTHLTVVITLGSSPKPTLVYVPGLKQGQLGAKQAIAPIGWVEERWIAIGVSIVYLQQLQTTRLLLLGAILAVCLGYLILAFSGVVAAQRRDFAILSALGWPPWQHARLFLMQALLFALVGGGLGVGAAVLLSTLLGILLVWLIVLGAMPAMLVLALLSALYPLWRLWHIQPAEILRSGAPITVAKTRVLRLPLWPVFSPISVLVVRNLIRARARTVMTIVSLGLSALLLVLTLSSILALHQTLAGTLLGTFVLLQTAGPQIAGSVFAVLLTFLSVANQLLLQVREREPEIRLLQAVGWRFREVRRLFVQEGLLLALVGAVPGVLVAQGILSAQHVAATGLPEVLVLLGALLLLLAAAVVATIPAALTVNRIQESSGPHVE